VNEGIRQSLLKNIWLHSYARASYQEVISFTESLRRFSSIQPNSHQRAFSAATLIAYCRPFKAKKGVRLPSDMIPDEYAELHRTMLTLRDKVISHHDPITPRTSFGYLNRVSIRITGKNWKSSTTFPVIPPKTAQEVQHLAGILQKKCDERIKTAVEALRLDTHFQDGDYVVEPEEDSDKFTIRQTT